MACAEFCSNGCYSVTNFMPCGSNCAHEEDNLLQLPNTRSVYSIEDAQSLGKFNEVNKNCESFTGLHVGNENSERGVNCIVGLDNLTRPTTQNVQLDYWLEWQKFVHGFNHCQSDHAGSTYTVVDNRLLKSDLPGPHLSLLQEYPNATEDWANDVFTSIEQNISSEAESLQHFENFGVFTTPTHTIDNLHSENQQIFAQSENINVAHCTGSSLNFTLSSRNDPLFKRKERNNSDMPLRLGVIEENVVSEAQDSLSDDQSRLQLSTVSNQISHQSFSDADSYSNWVQENLYKDPLLRKDSINDEAKQWSGQLLTSNWNCENTIHNNYYSNMISECELPMPNGEKYTDSTALSSQIHTNDGPIETDNFFQPTDEGLCYKFSTKTSPSSSSGTYFWQYNSQCKGPKASPLINLGNNPFEKHESKLSSSVKCQEDFISSIEPKMHHKSLTKPIIRCPISLISLPGYPLVMFEDPVQQRYDLVHCTKLRRGDGNDVTPNLMRLRAMGEELATLNHHIIAQGELIAASSGNSSTHSDGPYNEKFTRTNYSCSYANSRLIEQAKREKNKLASKICRLKKKSFHEANKIKYLGLEIEYNELASVLVRIKQLIAEYLRENGNKVKTRLNLADSFRTHQILSTRQNDRKVHVNRSEFDPGTTLPTASVNYHINFSLYRQALEIYEQTHVTRTAGRTDLLVNEVIKTTSNVTHEHPLVRILTNPKSYLNHNELNKFQQHNKLNHYSHMPTNNNIITSPRLTENVCPDSIASADFSPLCYGDSQENSTSVMKVMHPVRMNCSTFEAINP